MNIIQVQETLKGYSDDQLAQEMQMPTGNAPQYLVLTELERRKKMRDRYNAQAPQTTVAEDVVAQMQGGIGAMAPQAPMPQESVPMAPMMPQESAGAPLPPQMMAGGGVVKAQQGMYIPQDPTLRALMMQESGGDPSAVGGAGEIGAFQIRPTTAISPGYGIESLFPELEQAVNQGKYGSFKEAYQANKDMIDSVLKDPRRSEQFASSYLDAARSRFPGDEARAIASYNTGIAGAEKLEDPSSFPYVQGVAEKGLSPDETREAPSIPGISLAEADTGEGTGERPMSFLENLSYMPAALYDTVIGLPAAAAQNAYEYLTSDSPEYVHSQPAQQALRSGDSIVSPVDMDEVGPIDEFSNIPRDVAGGAPLPQAERMTETQYDAERRPGGPMGMVADIEARRQEADAQAVADQEVAEVPDAEKSYLQQLLDAQKEQMAQAEEQAKFNRYMALAQAGAKLASSTSPTFLGALGEATETGVESLKGAREPITDAELARNKLLATLATSEIEAAQDAKISRSDYMKASDDIGGQIDDLQESLSEAMTPEARAPLEARIAELRAQQDLYRRLAGLPGLTDLGISGTLSGKSLAEASQGILTERSNEGG